jgi:hypothetical protein
MGEGGWNLIFLDFFKFFEAITIKMTSFWIPTVKFEFKRNTWINQDAPSSYRPVAPTSGGITVGTNPANPNTESTTRPGRPLPLHVEGPLAQLAQAVPPRHWPLPIPTRTIATPIETSLRLKTVELGSREPYTRKFGKSNYNILWLANKENSCKK